MLVSVVLPVYNRAELIKYSLESLINQTYKNIEIITVNDGSTDNSEQILKEYTKIDSRIKLLNKTNGGCADARNYALPYCKGDYVVFLDSDDFYELYSIEYMVKLQEKSGADLILTGVQSANEYGYHAKTYPQADLDNAVVLTKEQALENLLYGRYSGVVAWGKMYRRQLLLDNPYRAIEYEDSFALFSIIRSANKIIAGRAITANRVSLDEGMTRGKFVNTRLNYFDACEQNIALAKKYYPYNRRLQRATATAYTIGGLGHFNQIILANRHNDLYRYFKRARSFWKETIFNRNIKLRSKLGYVLICLSPKFYARLKKLVDQFM